MNYNESAITELIYYMVNQGVCPEEIGLACCGTLGCVYIRPAKCCQCWRESITKKPQD
jgi:hypothetical protein